MSICRAKGRKGAAVDQWHVAVSETKIDCLFRFFQKKSSIIVGAKKNGIQKQEQNSFSNLKRSTENHQSNHLIYMRIGRVLCSSPIHSTNDSHVRRNSLQVNTVIWLPSVAGIIFSSFKQGKKKKTTAVTFFFFKKKKKSSESFLAFSWCILACYCKQYLIGITEKVRSDQFQIKFIA
jgi:hypothetical protein